MAITLVAGSRPGIRILTALGVMQMAGVLIGRDGELSQLCRLVDPPPDRSYPNWGSPAGISAAIRSDQLFRRAR
jgi:hypothetical protein